MTTESYLELLHRFDERDAYDDPHDMNLAIGLDLNDRAKRLHAKLLETLELEFTHPRFDHQDTALRTTFHIKNDIYGRECPLREGPPQPSRPRVAIAIDFSNFGYLATIICCSQEIMSAYPINDIIVLMEAEGFNYVPIKILRTEYDGVNGIAPMFPVGGENYMWFHRYFWYT